MVCGQPQFRERAQPSGEVDLQLTHAISGGDLDPASPQRTCDHPGVSPVQGLEQSILLVGHSRKTAGVLGYHHAEGLSPPHQLNIDTEDPLKKPLLTKLDCYFARHDTRLAACGAYLGQEASSGFVIGPAGQVPEVVLQRTDGHWTWNGCAPIVKHLSVE